VIEVEMQHCFGCHVDDAAGVVNLRLRGEIDMVSAPQLLDSLLCAAIAYGHTVVADLSAVTFMDSSGIAALVEAHRRITADGSTLLIKDPQPNVRRLMQLTGVDSYLALDQQISAAR
jgi:anti-anti-sigma factor